MRLLAAVLTATFVYLAVGYLTGNAPNLETRTRSKPQISTRQLWLIQSGSDLTPRQFWAGSIASGIVGLIVLGAVTGTWWVALIPSVALAFLPYSYFMRQRVQRLADVQKAWPDGLREVLAHVNSGATLAAAIEALAVRGPASLQQAFGRFPAQAKMFGVVPALEIVKEELSDPSSDKVIEVLILAHQFGGDGLKVVLRDLVETMTADQLTAEQIRTAGFEQRLEGVVVALAPWVMLVYLATVPAAYREFYRSSTGRFVVIVAGIWAGFGWVLMRLIARPAQEVRVFGGGSVVGNDQGALR
ncbi:MAG: type II secretion system F family protein [Acidimicrobiia bacterium]|nr:type II secretion system F family protein [Acidimicrobiia bacterium]MDX2468422.1 type II secretion system F family protein [Acidimicrobiia bacterium]